MNTVINLVESSPIILYNPTTNRSTVSTVVLLENFYHPAKFQKNIIMYICKYIQYVYIHIFI